MARLLIVTGPTATGKTELGIDLAKKFEGEIVVADSRQVYKSMDIGTGKDIDKSKFKSQKSKIQFKNQKLSSNYYQNGEIRIWGLDLVLPDYPFNVADFSEYASTVINNIQDRGKLPIVIGGTGLYLKALLDPFATMQIPPNIELRDKLSRYSITQLQKLLREKDTDKWSQMNESDKNNTRRLVRAIEVAGQSQKSKINPSTSLRARNQKFKSKVKNINSLIIGLTAPMSEIYRRIDVRVEKRIKEGMQEEVVSLLKRGYGWELPAMTGLGYREFKEAISHAEIITRWKTSEHQYAKRQLTYQKKYLHPHWFDITSSQYPENVFAEVEKWYHNGTHGQKTG